MGKDGRDREKEGWEGPRVMQCLWSASIRAMIRGVWNFGGLIAICSVDCQASRRR